MMRCKHLAFLCLLAGALACGSTEPNPTVTGTWMGVVSGHTFTLHLAQTGSAVSGDATVSNTSIGTAAFTVTGTFNYPAFSATLSSSALQPTSLQASMGVASAMYGTLNGSGFTGDAITLTR